MSASRVPGRIVDLGVLQGVVAKGPALVALSFGGAVGGRQVAGVQRVAEQFTALFLTVRGSCLCDASRGSDFMLLLRTGQLYSDFEVTSSFKLAASEVLDYMAAQVTEDTPDDERLTEADLSWFTLQPPSLLLGIKLTTAAGTAREIILPTS